MIVTMDLIFISKIILDSAIGIRTEVNIGGNVSDEDWVTSFDDFTLDFESGLWLNMVNYPNAIGISSGSRHESNLFTRNWGTNGW